MSQIRNGIGWVLVVALGTVATACHETSTPLPMGPESPTQDRLADPSFGSSGGSSAVILSTSDATVDLVAGQTEDVGDVHISDDGTDITIEITVDSPWCLVEFHFAAASEEDDIPQTKKGNPQPGQFDKYESEDDWTGLSGEPECVTSGSWSFPLPDVDPGDEIVVAVHTVVQKTVPGDDVQLQSDDAGSGLLTTVTAYRAGDEASFTNLPGDPAVLADQPDDYPNGLAEDPTVDTWGNAQNAIGQAMLSDGADWIWKTARVAEPLQGEVVEFSRSFDIPGVPTSGTLRMTCDNGFEAFVNGTSVGTGDVAGDTWELSELLEPDGNPQGVETSGWQTAHEFDVTSQLVSGSNELLFWGANESFEDNAPTPADAIHNPGGCLYTLDYSYVVLVEETAWGAGTEFPFDGNGRGDPGGDWGMYITYAPSACPAVTSASSPGLEALGEGDFPLDVTQGGQTSENVQYFAEGVTYDHAGIPLNILADNSFEGNEDADVAADLPVCSYYVHFDDGDLGDGDEWNGLQLTFDAPPLGAITAGSTNNADPFAAQGFDTLCDTDPVLGASGVTYPASSPSTCGSAGDARGLEIVPNQDRVEFMSGNVVEFDMQIGPRHDSFRILLPAGGTIVPSP